MTWSEPCLALAPVLGLLVACLAHIGCCWWLKDQRRLVGFGLAFAAGLVPTLTMSLPAVRGIDVTLADALTLALFNVASYAALAYGYYSFVGLNFSSLRIRLLQEILLAADGLPASEIQRRYGTEEIVARRLERLQGSGHLIERGGRFYLGKRTLLLVARLNDMVRFLVLGTTVAPAQNRGVNGQEASMSGDDRQLRDSGHSCSRK